MAVLGTQIRFATWSGMICVCMGDDSPFYRPPGINIKVAAAAKNAATSYLQDCVHLNEVFYFSIAPRVFLAIIAQALLRGDAKNIPAMINTGTAKSRPITGIIAIPAKVSRSPKNSRKKPTVTFDTRSSRHSVLFILSP